MTPPCAGCAKPLRIDLSSKKLSSLDNELRFEFGPFVITPEQAKEVRTMLALADKDIEDHAFCLHKETMVVQAEMKRLETQRAKLCALLSPTRKLPNETLLRIFEHVCDENLLQCYPWLWHKPPFTKITSPVIDYLPTMAISSVCSRWRTLALSSPSLWANLAVETYATTLDKAETFFGFTDVVIRYLERSGNSPLTLTLTIHGLSDSPSAKAASLIHLTQHTWRWKTFKYRGNHSLTRYNLPFSLRFPLLVKLDITKLKELGRFEHCSRLHALSAPWHAGPSPRTYNQLEHLKFRGHSLADLAEALHAFPSLKSLRLTDTVSPNGHALGTSPKANITSFAFLHGLTSEKVFSSFTFPCLTDLVVSGRTAHWRPTKAFTSFISRSSCMITTFTLRRIAVSDVDLIATLRLMPALLHLEVAQRSSPVDLTTVDLLTLRFISSLIHHQSTSVSLVPNYTVFI
ncbi:hypothetical protein BDP27DRAFT_1429607 [Rhodocollybia butyracea]|uniref:F-box domain-containing protein n=1 Tax=Rhodocollybia butyracea TaxID=206335 RepID=A0A9P5U011_9AGAR|nr:hypothetical protein BDP27DRAFT_1429607 [Rhodocollybia butyracea]